MSALLKRCAAALVVAGATLALGACVSDTTPVDEYRCRKQADCPEGRVCYLGYCDPADDPDAGSPDVSAGDRSE